LSIAAIIPHPHRKRQHFHHIHQKNHQKSSIIEAKTNELEHSYSTMIDGIEEEQMMNVEYQSVNMKAAIIPICVDHNRKPIECKFGSKIQQEFHKRLMERRRRKEGEMGENRKIESPRRRRLCYYFTALPSRDCF